MNKPETVTEAKRNTLIRAAVGLLQHERTAAVAIEMLGAEPHSFIAIGTATEIIQLLREDDEPVTASSHPARRMRHGDRPTGPLSWEDGDDTPASQASDTGAELAPMTVADAMRIVRANWGDVAAIERAFSANAAAQGAQAESAPSPFPFRTWSKESEMMESWAANAEHAAAPTDAAPVPPDDLPRWIDNLKGSDPTIDSLIEYIIAQRAAAPVSGGELGERELFEATLGAEILADQGQFALSRAYSDGHPYTFLATKWAYRAWQARAAVAAAKAPTGEQVAITQIRSVWVKPSETLATGWHDVAADSKEVEHAREHPDAYEVRTVYAAPVEQGQGAGVVPDWKKSENEWLECERIANLPDVDEALRGFSDDPTHDGAVCIVRAVVAATNGKASDGSAA